MLKLSFTFILAGLMLGMTVLADTAPPKGPTPLANVDKKLPMLDLLPVGSILDYVSLPRYEGPRLTMLLTADKMKVAAPHEIAGYLLNIYLYGKDGQTTHMSSGEASYLLDKKLIISRQETTIREPKFSATGSGLYLDTSTKRGFLLGPVTTSIHMDQLKK